MISRFTDEKNLINDRLLEAAMLDIDLYIAVHTNGRNGSARGILVLTELTGAKSWKAAGTLYNKLVRIYPDQKNFYSPGVVSGGTKGCIFTTPREGIHPQEAHRGGNRNHTRS